MDASIAWLPQTVFTKRILMELCFILNNYVKVQQGSCEVYPAPFAVFIGKDDKNYVEPDISVICDKSKLTDKGMSWRPDFIIEIVSPSSRKMDYTTKNALYSDFGVREYWIVDPVKERTTVYRYEERCCAYDCSFFCSYHRRNLSGFSNYHCRTIKLSKNRCK